MPTTENLPRAQRVILDAVTSTPRTPAEIKRALFPAAPPVATIRALLGALAEAGLVQTAASAKKPGTTAWVRTEA